MRQLHRSPATLRLTNLRGPPYALGRQIVERRLQTLEYIKRVYAGECHWLSVALLPSSEEANKQLDKQAKDAETAQALRWFYLSPGSTMLPGAAVGGRVGRCENST